MLKPKSVKPRMQDPPRYPKVTIPMDNEFKGDYKRMLKAMETMLKLEVTKAVKNENKTKEADNVQ
jgi:predicted nucleotidyltransferase